jgi:hypothetical protein
VDGLDRVGRAEPEDLGEERQLALERSDQAVGLPEAVILPVEQQVGVRDPPFPEGVDDALRLGGGDHLVLLALEDHHRAGDLVGVVVRRALAVDRLRLGQRSHQPVEIARLELVGLAREREQVADAEVADAGAEVVPEGERA